MIQSLVEAVDHVLVLATAAIPLALGAAKCDVPLPVAGGGPIGRINEIRAALGTDVKIAAPTSLSGGNPSLENAWLEATLHVRSLGCLPVCHFESFYRLDHPDALGGAPHRNAGDR